MSKNTKNIKNKSANQAKFSLKVQNISEKVIQQSYIEWTNHYWWAPFVVHAANELPMSPGPALFRLLSFRKSMGVKSGYPDIMIDVPVYPYHGMRMELKRQGCKPTKKQFEYLARLEDMDYFTCWADNIGDAINYTKNYLGELLTVNKK